MPNPDDNNNIPVKNKQKKGKEFVQENDAPQQENINVESNYKSQGTKPVSINLEGAVESRAVGNSTSKTTSGSLGGWPEVKKQESLSTSMNNSSGGWLENSSGGLSKDPKLSNKTAPNQTNRSSGGMGAPPKDYVAKTPKGNMPKVNVSSSSMLTDSPKETTETEDKTPKEKTPPTKKAKGTVDAKEKEPKKEKEIAVSGELKKIFSALKGESKEEGDKTLTPNADKEGAKKVEEAKNSIVVKNNLQNTPVQDVNGASMGGGGASMNKQSTPENAEGGTGTKKKVDPKAGALAAFEVSETEDEIKEDAVINEIKNEGKNHGLMVGRSIGYGAIITPVEDGKFSITKFSESDDPVEEQAAQDKYNQDNDRIAKNMESLGKEEPLETGETANPKKGYYSAYIEGYNEGHREGSALKKEAALAERTAKMKAEQGTDEYMVGASLGMLCGVLTAKGETEVDTKFSMTKDGEFKIIPLKTTVAELDSAAFGNKQTPGGELSGATYEKAFLLHYNMGYREGQNQRTQPPPMDEDYKRGYEQGYKLGSQKGNGEKGEEDLLKLEATYDAKDEKTIKKEELQAYRGFYAGYNKGYRQVQEAKKNKAKTEREEKNKNPNFKAGYSTGNLKGFLTAMIEPSGIDLLAALESTAKMEEAGVPDYFPIPDELRESIKATLRFGDVAKSDSEKNPTKALLGQPLFKEGLLFGYNRGYRQGQNSRAAFKRDKHKMHPDYQRSVLVLMPNQEAEYTGPVGDGTFIKGFTIGQILANAQFELNELTKKQNQSEKDKTRFTELTKAIAALNAVIGKENSYYKSGVDEFFNWWMGVLAKRAQEKKTKYGYSGEEGSDKRNGFEWGLQVGTKVVEGKEKIKEINRKGRDIKARSAQLNAAIKKSEAAAKVTSKNKGGEDYYIGYRNGYNHAFRVAKEDKKSDKGNLDTDDLLENAGNKGSRLIGQIYDGVITKIDLKIALSKQDFSEAVENVKDLEEGKTAKAFENGLARGYSSGYSATVFDVKTGAITTDSIKSDEEHIRKEYDTYKKKYKGNAALRVLYFFLVGYQYHNKGDLSTKYGLPKGIADAQSFNTGYEVATAESGDSKSTDRSGEAKSKDAYKAGYNAAKYQARYDAFKKGMVRSAVGTNTETTSEKGNNTSSEGVNNGKDENSDKGGNVKGAEGKGTVVKQPTPKAEVDHSLTNGFAALAEAEHMDLHKGKEEESKFYLKGYEEATMLWTKIIYMRKGVHLEGADIPEEVPINLLEEGASIGDEKPISLTTDDMETATQYYYNQDELIQKIANYYIEDNFTWELFMSALSLDFSALKDAWDNYDKEKANARQKYIDGYKAKIAFIEGSYKEKFINNWLHDLAYQTAIMEVAPGTSIEIPGAPYTQMSGKDIDYESPHYKDGFLEGLKVANLIKTGVLQPSGSDLSKVGGSDRKKGFKEGTERGAKDGLRDIQEPLKELPSKRALSDELDEIYKKQHNGENDGMNYEYDESYIEAYFAAYKETRSYEYGRLLGYKRGAKGGNAMFNSEPEKGVRIDDKNAFFKGFDAGREVAVLGFPIEALHKEIKKDNGSYGENYAEILKDATEDALDENQREEIRDNGLGKSGNSALDVLNDLLFGGTQDFYLDELLLLDMFYALETKIEDVQHYIKADLQEIEFNRSLAGLSSREGVQKDLEKLAQLEKDLKDESLSEGEKASLDLKILVLKAEIKENNAVYENWQAAELAAKQKIDSIRRLMKDSLAFDTPLESNEDILTYIKINLESSKGNNEDIYEQIDIFNDLSLEGAFNYTESKNVDVSILGNANFYIDHYAENVHIENADIQLQENGFEFKARGLSYVKDDYQLTFMSGSIVTPSIEGGAHMGERYKYNFDDFNVHLSQGIKSEMDAQKYKLEGGSL